MYEYKAQLKEVIDGDTIDVILDLGFSISVEQRLRLADIDTAELRSSDPLEKQKAQDAKAFVRGFIGTSTLIVSTRKTNAGKNRVTFGRYVADVQVCRVIEGVQSIISLNKAIVEAGHAGQGT